MDICYSAVRASLTLSIERSERLNLAKLAALYIQCWSPIVAV